MIYRITKVLSIILLSGVFACSDSTDIDYKVPVDLADIDYNSAVNSAEAWLILVDEGKYSNSWKAAASHLKQLVTADQWDVTLNNLRKQHGKVLSRSLKYKENTTSLPGVPDAEYVVIQYETNFENKRSVMETITVMLEVDGTWRVSWYDLAL